MPIDCKFSMESISKSGFHELDYGIMRLAFSVQNDLGRLCHESIYQRELIFRCEAEGISAITEGEIVVSHGAFKKSYFIDALMGHGAIYELKALDDLHGRHESQLLNYLFLTELNWGKLINFSSPSVQHRFVTTNLDHDKRHSFTIDASAWAIDAPVAEEIRNIVEELVDDWGAFLDIELYRCALIHFLGGEERIMKSVDIVRNGRVVGSQHMHVLDGDVGLHLSSTIRNDGQYQTQLLRMLRNTNLDRMLWINFARDTIHFTTLDK